MKAQNVVIIGAPRSGTNMLRDWLCSIDGVATWPCDEINPIWRHGNLHHPSDRFTPDMATPGIQRFIRERFAWVARRYGAGTVVEKTCANSLRVGFVDQVLDEPKYLFIHRDGIDATASAMKRWTAKADLPYVLRKARFVPVSDLPISAWRFLSSRVLRQRSAERRLPTWGPVIPDMQALAASHPLAELCALQWRECVLKALEDFQHISPERVLRLDYATIVRDKEAQAASIADFLGLEVDRLIGSSQFERISPRSLGRGAKELGGADLDRVEAIVQPVMARLASS